MAKDYTVTALKRIYECSIRANLLKPWQRLEFRRAGGKKWGVDNALPSLQSSYCGDDLW